MLQRQLLKLDHHKNGRTEAPYHVVLFEEWHRNNPTDKHKMVATVFQTPGHVAVFNLTLLNLGTIQYGQNSYGGHHYETILRTWIAERDQTASYTQGKTP